MVHLSLEVSCMLWVWMRVGIGGDTWFESKDNAETRSSLRCAEGWDSMGRRDGELEWQGKNRRAQKQSPCASGR